MPRQRDYKAEYQSRIRKARTEGYTGYGQKRYRQTKAKQQIAASPQTQLQNMFPTAVLFTELSPYQRDRWNRLKLYGVNRNELDRLLVAGPDFWKQARPMLERESELAKGH